METEGTGQEQMLEEELVGLCWRGFGELQFL